MEGGLFSFVLLCTVWLNVEALFVSIPQKAYDVARGGSVTIPCTFKTPVQNPTAAVIIWSRKPDQPDAENVAILTYFYPDESFDLAERFDPTRFSIEANVQTGQANLLLKSLKLEDSMLYECQVQIRGDTTGNKAAITNVMVWVPPTKPICNVQGKPEYGQNINLTCVSEEASPSPTYKWESYDVQNNLRPLDPQSTVNGGILSLFDVTKEMSGYYVCTSTNKVGSASSNFTLSIVSLPPTKPILNVQGKPEYGQNINLTCVSEEASPSPTYKWESYDVLNNLRPLDPKSTVKGGILSLFNVTKETSGYYICTSTNKVGSASSNFTLSVLPPSLNIGSTAGIIGGVAAALILLVIIICCCYCRKKKQQEEAYAMGAPEYTDKDPDGNDENHHPQESSVVYSDSKGPITRRDQYEEKSEHNDDRRSDINDRRRDYDDRRSDFDDRRSDFDDRRSDINDRRRDYDDRRSDFDDQRSNYSDRRDKYSDRNERYDDDRHYDDERRYDDRRGQR
uniref:Ig-like domain-containing protein n=1 Tax=Oryzias latipes TaxID=8090 RepID=A0A3B3I0E4_ORYLA